MTNDASDLAAARRRITELERVYQHLRQVLSSILSGDYPTEVETHWRKNKLPSKHDLCPHQVPMWDQCGQCIDDFILKEVPDLRPEKTND